MSIQEYSVAPVGFVPERGRIKTGIMSDFIAVFVFTCLCSDFDECTVYGTCSQTCTNTEGSYSCSCVEGYLAQPDNRSCKAKNGNPGSFPASVCPQSLGYLSGRWRKAGGALYWCI
ncbi:hypothetical protein NFI96_001324 [Prochilodus magdalenae]|nr:hypothetical protein NFI96_001324 [Prochilodus magdalenae]